MRQFSVGQTVVILTYEDRKRGNNSYAERQVAGRFKKSSSYSRFHSDKYTADPEGKYIGVRDCDRVRTCQTCTGSGKVRKVPSMSPLDRIDCPDCGGEGERNYASTHLTYVLDQKNRIMSLDEYAPIANAKIDRANRAAEALKEAMAARQALVSQLVHLFEDGELVDAELTVAKWLLKNDMGDLHAAARNVIEARKPRCSAGCGKAATEYADYEGKCSQCHWTEREAALLAAAAAEEVA